MLLAHMDTYGDQRITPDEFTGSFGHAITDRSGFDSAVSTAASPLQHMAGQDGNGVLDAAELTAAISQFFTQLGHRCPGNLAFGLL
jgi:hypothetical protein